MDRQLREMERRIAADGCQEDDVEAFIVRCMRSQSLDFIESTIEQWIRVYNQKTVVHKLSLRRTSHQTPSMAMASATIHLTSGQAQVDLTAIDRIQIGNSSVSDYTGELILRATGSDACFMSININLGPGQFLWISDFYQHHIDPGQTFTFELAPPGPIQISAIGVR